MAPTAPPNCMQRLGLSISLSLLRCIRRVCRKALRTGSGSQHSTCGPRRQPIAARTLLAEERCETSVQQVSLSPCLRHQISPERPSSRPYYSPQGSADCELYSSHGVLPPPGLQISKALEEAERCSSVLVHREDVQSCSVLCALILCALIAGAE